MYQWTGDDQYISSSDFNRFDDLTVKDYIERWDLDGDVIPERAKGNSHLGITSYDENVGYNKAKVMIDLIAIQARPYESYAWILKLRKEGVDREVDG